MTDHSHQPDPTEPFAPVNKPARTRLIVTLLQPDHVALDSSVVRQLSHAIRQRIEGVPDQYGVDLWLDSPGGDPHAAYKLIGIVRELVSHVRVVVPDTCKGGSVLLALGSDELITPRSAEFGPLDAIIVSGETKHSALELTAAYDTTVVRAREQALAAVTEIADAIGLSETDAIDKALAFGVQVNHPLLFEFDPVILQQARAGLEAARRYGRRCLDRRIEKGQVLTGQTQLLDKLLERLTDRYDSPKQIISAVEFDQLGLPIVAPRMYRHYDAAQTLADRVQQSGEPLYWVFSETETDTYLRAD